MGSNMLALNRKSMAAHFLLLVSTGFHGCSTGCWTAQSYNFCLSSLSVQIGSSCSPFILLSLPICHSLHYYLSSYCNTRMHATSPCHNLKWHELSCKIFVPPTIFHLSYLLKGKLNDHHAAIICVENNTYLVFDVFLGLTFGTQLSLLSDCCIVT